MPVDFDSHVRSVTSSPETCRDRCSSTSGCIGSSWWSDGGCHLAGSGATLQSDSNVQSYSCSGMRRFKVRKAKPISAEKPL